MWKEIPNKDQSNSAMMMMVTPQKFEEKTYMEENQQKHREVIKKGQ